MNITEQISYNLIYIFRRLQNDNNNANQTALNEVHQRQLRDLYIYLAALVALIIIIIGGYALYRKCIEKRVLEEIEREYQLMIYNMLNNSSSQNSSSEDKKIPHSYNNLNNTNLRRFENVSNDRNMNASLDYNNHEERMENIRKRFGNSIVIKILIKKQIEEIPFTKNFVDQYGDLCTICMEKFDKKDRINKTPCEHIFHKQCFNKYLATIKGKDKLLCPNCNQNLLINKKFLKLRVKTKKIEIKKEISKQKEIESEIDLESQKRHSVMTNKNDDYLPQGSNELIFIKKKLGKSEKNKINNNDKLDKNKNNSNNIYNPLQINIKNERDTKISCENKKERGENNIIDNNKKKCVILLNGHKKSNNNIKNVKKDDETKKNNNNNNGSNNINEINSERQVITITKKISSPRLSHIKQDN